jgi:hypothetical protein
MCAAHVLPVRQLFAEADAFGAAAAAFDAAADDDVDGVAFADGEAALEPDAEGDGAAGLEPDEPELPLPPSPLADRTAPTASLAAFSADFVRVSALGALSPARPAPL